MVKNHFLTINDGFSQKRRRFLKNKVCQFGGILVGIVRIYDQNSNVIRPLQVEQHQIITGAHQSAG